jgi:hypothetical protein
MRHFRGLPIRCGFSGESLANLAFRSSGYTMQGGVRDFLRREGWPFVISCGLVYVTFIIQLLGITFTDQDYNPIIRPAPPAWRFVGEMGLDISTLAPLLGIFAVYLVRTPVAYETVPTNRRFVWALALVSVLLSFAEFWLSWNGHPIWLRGFVG